MNLRRLSVFALATIAILNVAGPRAAAGPLNVTMIDRQLTGSARVTSTSFDTLSDSFNESQSGLGSIGPIEVVVFGFGQTTRGRGVVASAELDQSAALTSVLSLETSTLATSRVTVPVIGSPHNGQATSTVTFEGTVDYTGSTISRDLIFSAQYSAEGNNNTGFLRVMTDTQGEIFNQDLASLTSDWTLSIAPASLVTIYVTMTSSSFRGSGAFTNTTYTDADSQQFLLSLTGTAIPEPASLLSLGVGLVGMGIRLRRTRRDH